MQRLYHRRLYPFDYDGDAVSAQGDCSWEGSIKKNLGKTVTLSENDEAPRLSHWSRMGIAMVWL